MFCRKLKVSEGLLAKAEGKPQRGDSCCHVGGGQKSEEARRPSAEGPRARVTHDSFSLIHKRRCPNVIV
jgi:hypothetical protein